MFPFSVSILVSHSETFLLLVFRCFEFLANRFEGNCWIVFLYVFCSIVFQVWRHGVCFSFLLLFIFPFSHFLILKQLLFVCVFFPFVFSSLFSFTFCTFFLFPYFFSSSLLYPSPVQINSKKTCLKAWNFLLLSLLSLFFSCLLILKHLPSWLVYFLSPVLSSHPIFLLLTVLFSLTSSPLSCCTFPRFTLTKIFTILAPSHLSFFSFISCPAHDHTNSKQGNRLEGMDFYFVFPLSFFSCSSFSSSSNICLIYAILSYVFSFQPPFLLLPVFPFPLFLLFYSSLPCSHFTPWSALFFFPLASSRRCTSPVLKEIHFSCLLLRRWYISPQD